MSRPMMMQAVTTKWLAPSNVRGSRIKATAEAGSIILSYDHAHNADANHIRAAQALAFKFGWRGCWFGGALPKSAGYVFVNVHPGYRNEDTPIRDACQFITRDTEG